jgi:hypothetical protein
MTVLSNRAEEDSLKERALYYKNEGYSVHIEPAADFLPDFLKEFPIDLIAQNKNESIVVEVKSRNELIENPYVEKLAEVIQTHPGWHFELVLLKDEPPSLPEADPKAILREVEALQSSGYSDAALLLIWSAIEISLRKVVNRENVDVNQKSIDLMLQSLVSLGLLEDDIYKKLWEARKVRNEVAHGFATSKDIKVLVDELLAIARTLV